MTALEIGRLPCASMWLAGRPVQNREYFDASNLHQSAAYAIVRTRCGWLNGTGRRRKKPSIVSRRGGTADAIDLGSITERCGGSSPLVGTKTEGARCGQLRARGLAGRRLLCKQKIVGSNPTGSTSPQCDTVAENVLTDAGVVQR